MHDLNLAFCKELWYPICNCSECLQYHYSDNIKVYWSLLIKYVLIFFIWGDKKIILYFQKVTTTKPLIISIKMLLKPENITQLFHRWLITNFGIIATLTNTNNNIAERTFPFAIPWRSFKWYDVFRIQDHFNSIGEILIEKGCYGNKQTLVFVWYRLNICTKSFFSIELYNHTLNKRYTKFYLV